MVARKSRSHRVAPDPLAKRVGERVRALRGQREFTFDAFVEETGLGRGYISELERGLVMPSLETLSRLAAALDVTIADLVAGDSDREILFVTLRDASSSDLRGLRREIATRYATAAPEALMLAERPRRPKR